MQNLLRSFSLIFLLLTASVEIEQLGAQCYPRGTDLCDDAFVFCGLDELNGYSCRNPDYPNTVGPDPICPGDTHPHNITWWAFVSRGGNVCVTMSYDNCDPFGGFNGMQIGIYSDCTFDYLVACDPSCGPTSGVKTICASLLACHVYYLFIDGCWGDFCDFTLNTNGSGGIPDLTPLGFINDKPNGIIEPVCKGACKVPFHVKAQTGGCLEAIYTWTLDGNEVGTNSNDIKLDFPDEGDFILCVTAVVGNPYSGSICAQEGPICATVKVKALADKTSKPRTLCYEEANPKAYKWHSQFIGTSGTYREHFIDNVTCCNYDSVVEFVVNPVPDPADVYYITCNNQPYVDILNHTYTPCKDHYEVKLPKTTDPFQCDSTIMLTAINVEYSPRWRIKCMGGQVELSPNILQVKPCRVGETYEFDYRWYKKNDPAKKTINTDENLLVDPVNEEYCLEVNVRVNLGSIHSICSNTFCELFNEADLGPKCFPLAGDETVCLGKNGAYWIDTFISQNGIYYTWAILGGLLISKPDSQGIEVKWNLNAGDTGTVCVFYNTDCGVSCTKCMNITIRPSPLPNAGPNDSICDLANKFQGIKDAGGQWTQISGPGNSNITDSTDPTSDVVVDKYGLYRFIYNETKSGCDGTDTVDLYFNPIPDSSALSYQCNSKQSQYKLRFLITGGMPPYTVAQGNGAIDVNNYYNSNLYDNLTTYTVLIRDNLGCELSFSFNHECKCTNVAGTINKNMEEVCADQSFTLIYDPTFQKLDPGDTIIYVISKDSIPDHAVAGTFIKMQSSMTVVFDPGFMNYNTTYYIIVLIGKKNGKGGIDFQAGCVQADGPKPFIFYQVPSPNAGVDDVICGTRFDLKGLQSINGSNLKWKLVSGNGVNFADDTASSASINTNGQYGNYVFELSEDNKGCAVADRVSITFNPIPFISVEDKICIEHVPPFRYKANIKITNGQPPFIILQGAGSIMGNIFTTDTLPSLAQFKIEIRDANNCISNLIIDDYNCNCGNIDAGQLDTALVEVCVDQCVTIKNLIGEITDKEDAVIYILHQSSYNETNPAFPKIDTFYSVNDLVCFHPSQMTTGRTYYITRVVGDSTISNGKKIVKDSDPCKRVTSNQPIVWYSYPAPDAGPNDSICFYNYQLNGITNTGTPNWKFLSGPGQSTIANANSDITNVNVSSPGAYVYQLTENFKGCISKDTVDITYWDAPMWKSPTPECDNIAEHYSITVDGLSGDRSSWIIDGIALSSGILLGDYFKPNTWRTDWITNNDIYRLILNDRHNCLPDTISGTFNCPCITSIGKLDHTFIELCTSDTARANYNAVTGIPDGNDVIRFVLFDGNPADPKSGNLLKFNSNGRFVFDPATMTPGKKYYIAVFIGNVDPANPDKILFSDRCLQFDVVPVVWDGAPKANISGPKLLTCAITTITLDGSLSTDGSAGSLLNYIWSTIDGNLVGSTSNNSAQISSPGTYKLKVENQFGLSCSDETNFRVDIDNTKPIVRIAPAQVLTCNRMSVMLDGSASSQGNEYKINWLGPGTIANGSTYKPSINSPGTYRLIITNQLNACVDSFSINVIGDLKKPVPEIKALGQLVCATKEIQLDASGSKGQSGPIDTYIWQTNNGSIIAGLGTSIITIDKPGNYQVTVKDQLNGCDSIATLDVVEIGNSIAGIELNSQDPKCFGDRNGKIDLNGIVAIGPVNGLQYSFNNGIFGNATNFPNLSQGIYHIKVKDNNGCEHDTLVKLIEPGRLGMQVIKNLVVDLDTPVNLDSMLLSVTGGTKNYQDTSWFNINQNQNWPGLHYLADTTRDFLITVTDAVGCQIQERVKVIVRIIQDVWWPSAFSPNSDGANDVWNIKGKRISNIRTLNIYDRWGEMVFTTKNIKEGSIDPTAGWHGFFKGEKALPGVYVFYAEIEHTGSVGYDKYKGEFTLLR